MWAVGMGCLSAQWRATVVFPAPAGPINSTAIGPLGICCCGGCAGNWTGAPAGRTKWPVAPGGTAIAC
ncbi:hypothetical protein KNE206_02920 [Kitasatospora sp. NE20-6]